MNAMSAFNTASVRWDSSTAGPPDTEQDFAVFRCRRNLLWLRTALALALYAMLIPMFALVAATAVLAQAAPASTEARTASVRPWSRSRVAAQADTLEGHANSRFIHGDFTGALTGWEKALDLRSAHKDRVGEETDMRRIGDVYLALGQYTKALDEYQQALAEARTLNDRQDEERNLSAIGNLYEDLGQYGRALDFEMSSLTMAHSLGDTHGEEVDLGRIGNVYDDLGNHGKALDNFQQALAKAHALGDVQREESDLGNIGIVYMELAQYAKAITFDQQSLAEARAIGDKEGEEAELGNTGLVYDDLSQYSKALDYLLQVLKTARAIGDKQGEEADLSNIGSIYEKLGQYANALEYDRKALTQARAIGFGPGEQVVLCSIGVVYENMSQFAKALDYEQQALTKARAMGDTHGAEQDLDGIGNVYVDLGQYAQALEYEQRSLTAARAVGDKQGEEHALGNIGNVYEYRGEYAKALDDYQQILAEAISIGDTHGVEQDLDNIGIVYEHLGQYAKALTIDQQALTKARTIGDKPGEEHDLGGIGNVYIDLGQYAMALDYEQQALTEAHVIGYRSGEADTTSDLMHLQNLADRVPLAIFLGKRAVNVYQSIRGGARQLSREVQRDYLHSVQPAYLELIGLLLKQRRIGEAIQVLNRLRQEEYLNDNPDLARASDTVRTPVDFTPHEQRWQSALDNATGDQYPVLFKQMSDDFARSAVRPDPARDALSAVSDVSDLQETLAHLGPGTVALYTFEDDTSLHLLLVSPTGAVIHRVAAVDRVTLDKQVTALREALQQPEWDPRPRAQAVYQELFGPIEGDLNAQHASTILLALDGPLRAIPPAALWDGTQYVVQKWTTCLFTPASLERLEATPAATPTVLAAGVSEPQDGNVALPGVETELNAIVRDPANPQGLLPGVSLLNGRFTEESLLADLATKTSPHPSLLHLASHFRFGDSDTDSYLLLGDGGHWTLGDIKAAPAGLFEGVDLITLSACETATSGSDRSGHELENFSVLAQRKGATAVLATLWPVDDAATSAMLPRFYALDCPAAVAASSTATASTAPPSPGKAAALRAAQREMLEPLSGAPPDAADASDADAPPAPRTRGTRGAILIVSVAPDLPRFPKGLPRYAHPYYWAAFVLIGNPR
jgi:CHAT domain-containing protein